MQSECAARAFCVAGALSGGAAFATGHSLGSPGATGRGGALHDANASSCVARLIEPRRNSRYDSGGMLNSLEAETADRMPSRM